MLPRYKGLGACPKRFLPSLLHRTRLRAKSQVGSAGDVAVGEARVVR